MGGRITPMMLLANQAGDEPLEVFSPGHGLVTLRVGFSQVDLSLFDTAELVAFLHDWVEASTPAAADSTPAAAGP